MTVSIRHSVLLVVLSLVTFSVGCGPVGGYKVTPVPVDQSLQEQVVYRDPGWVTDRIAVIDLNGVLINERESSFFSEGEQPVSLFVEKLNAAAADSRVKAVVLRINSPGGTVTASDAMYQEVLRFREQTKKPVIAYFQDFATSGAYYVACAADVIAAQRTSVTGSIGVVMQMVDFSGSMLKLGITAEAITSGPYKDAGSPFRKMKPEEREVFQYIIDGFYNQFVDVVAAGRPNLAREKIVTMADGRIYTADQAKDAGLVDEITTLRGVIELAKQRAGLKSAVTVLYHRPLEWSPTIYATSPAGQPQAVNLININLPKVWTSRPCFMYILYGDK